MTTLRPLAQFLLTVGLSLSLGACLMDLDTSVDSADAEAAATGISLAITAPTDLSTMDTTDESVTLGGTADSNDGIVGISWANDRGGEGTANGTLDWKTTAIALELGENVITVTAENGRGTTRSRRVKVKRESGETSSTTLSWVAPTARTDGTPLADLAGYTILYGRMSGVYDYRIDIDNAGVSSYVVENLVPGEWYFALVAVDGAGIESERSNEVTRTIS